LRAPFVKIAFPIYSQIPFVALLRPWSVRKPARTQSSPGTRTHASPQIRRTPRRRFRLRRAHVQPTARGYRRVDGCTPLHRTPRACELAEECAAIRRGQL